MRTVAFQSVLTGVAVRAGLDITQSIPGNLAAAYTEYINRRLRQAQEAAVWPELTTYEQRRYRADYDAATAYAAGDEVYYSEAYYRCILATTGNLPTDATYWTANPVDFLRNISLDQAGKTAMGEVVSVSASDPRLGYAVPVGYRITGDGIVVMDSGLAAVWVCYTLRPKVYVYTSTETDFPYVLGEIVKAGAAADVLREEGMPDKASVHDAIAADLFQQEMDKLEFKQQQQGRFRGMGR